MKCSWTEIIAMKIEIKYQIQGILGDKNSQDLMNNWTWGMRDWWREINHAFEVFSVENWCAEMPSNQTENIKKEARFHFVYIAFKISEEHSWVCPEDSFK